MTTTGLENLTGDYTLDPAHTRLGFVARHAMITKVRGQFNDFEGHAHIDFTDPAACSAEVTIQAVSVDTRNEQRDGHLRTNDFFDVPNNPEISYRSTAVEKVGDDTYRLAGDLTIRGVTNPVTIDFEFTGAAKDPWGNTRVGLEGHVVINRKDWGVNFNAALETGGVLISEKVTLEIELSLVKDQ
jgi:polyisoprenoid-binding protein YceI